MRLLSLALVLAVAAFANAQLYNADMEFQPGPKFSSLEGWRVTGGGWADHAGFAAPNNGGLGLNFGFYDARPGGGELVGQVSEWTFAPNTSYLFDGWAVAGGGVDITLPWQIGYLSGGTNINDHFVELGKFLEAIPGKNAGGQWDDRAGVVYTTGASGPEIGLPIVVRLGKGDDGAEGSGGLWFDNLSLSIVPEPATLALLGLGLLLRRR